MTPAVGRSADVPGSVVVGASGDVGFEYFENRGQGGGYVGVGDLLHLKGGAGLHRMAGARGDGLGPKPVITPSATILACGWGHSLRHVAVA